MRALQLLASLCFAMFCSRMAAEKPFSFDATPGKLPKEVLPVEYLIRIVPDIDKLTFAGSETVKINVRRPVRELVLNALELQIQKAALDGKALPDSGIKADPANETLTLVLPSELGPGQHLLALDFAGKINQQGQGLFYMPYQEQGTGAKKIMLGTQFEPTDARRLFPCWDEPVFRARFQLTAVVPDDWLAVSNMPVESHKKIPKGKEVRFAATPPMSSYLNVLVAGELDLIESRVGPTQIRVIATRGKAKMGRYALEATAQILKYYNDYFGVPYPLPKLDQIAMPGGFGGAMENWGGITYYESSLLFDPKNSSTDTKQNIYEVLAHEMAHQWFGDLVTMAWWDNLWLNEGFASWMGSKCTAHFNPQWEVWLRRDQPRDPTRRIGIAKEAAMEGDARSTTHPIQQPVHTEAEADSVFDDITYKKGESFLRMLESFLGENVFRDGIRRYMASHKYSNSTTADLWNALSQASHQPIAQIAAGWTEQPGFPVVRVNRENGKVSLRQERFTVHFKNAPPLEWKVPLTYAVAEGLPQSMLMTSKVAWLENIPANRALKLNLNGTGNYRVEYDETSWDLLLQALSRLSVADRVNLLCDAWALVQANRAPVSLYFDLVEKLPASTELAEREQIINVLEYINRLLIGVPLREKFQAYARSLLRPTFEALEWKTRNAAEPPTARTLRASLISALGCLNDGEIVAGCRARFAGYLSDPKSLEPDLRPAVFSVAGRYADEKIWNQLHEIGLKTTSIEEKQNFYNALACVTDPALAKRTLAIALTDELPTSRATFLVGRVARDSDHPELAWDFARKNMKALLAKTDALGANRYVAGLFTFFSDASRAEELKQYAGEKLPPAAAPEVAKVVDEVEFRAEFRKRLAAQLNGWIDSKKPQRPITSGRFSGRGDTPAAR